MAHYTKPGEGALKVTGFVLYGAMVGLHSLSFWKSIYKVPKKDSRQRACPQ